MDTANDDDKGTAAHGATTSGRELPFSDLASIAVKRISNQPFLFVIVIAVLAIGLTTVGATLGFSDVKFFVITALIFLLAAIALIGFYLGPSVRTPEVETPRTPEVSPVQPLASPRPDKPAILIDLGHDQGLWAPASIFAAASPDGRFQRLILEVGEDLPWELGTVTDPRQITRESLRAWRGLILGMPYHRRISLERIEEVVQWVLSGGRLLLLGFEMGDRHHDSNINELAAKFGLHFNSDIVGARGWQPPGKPYSPTAEPTQFSAEALGSHPVLKGVNSLTLPNACTLSVEAGATVLIKVDGNALCRAKPGSVVYTNGRITSGNMQFESANGADWMPIMAEAPYLSGGNPGLTGNGRVIGLGTWELVGRDFGIPTRSDNKQFVRNLLDWLAGKLN